MSGLFNTLNTATKGLMASQTSLHTTGHNISNMNTPGYRRQRVDLKADRAYSFTGVGQLGTGVKMESIVRMVDNHVSKQIRNEMSTLNTFGEKSDVISQLEVIFNEPSDTGLNFNINEMFKAFENLAGNPGDVNFKTVAVGKLKTLTDTLNQMAGQIDRLESETHEAIDKNVLDFNSKVEQLNALNKQIFNISIKGQVPNDLLDQRDVLLEDLSSIGKIDTDFDEYGRVEIKMNDKEILPQMGKPKYIAYDKEGADSREIRIYDNKEDAKVADPGKGTLIKIKDGKILGNMEAVKDVKESKTSLDKLASTMASAINRVYPDDGAIFKAENLVDPIDAKNITINDALVKDPRLLQSGKHPVGDAGYLPGDASTAKAIADIQNIKLDKDGSPSIDGKGNTIGGYYRDIVIGIGISKQHSDNMVDNQIALTNQLIMREEAVSGVSLNDEITDVMKFQKSYEANAKVISALTEMLDVLINRTGV